MLTATTPNPSQTAITTLPPPQTFDFLPPFHALLSRLLLPGATDVSTPSPDTITPISLKDLATAASSITAKIQKARNAVRGLAGMEMAIEEQASVIKELEEELERLKGVEAGIARAAREGTFNDRTTSEAKDDGEVMEET